MQTTRTASLAALAIAGFLVAGGAQAHTWTGNVSADWHTPGNWDGNAVPGADETAVISSGTVVLAQPTAALTALTMNGGTLVFSNWTTRLTASTVALNSGTIKTAGPFNSYTNAYWPSWIPSNRVAITCATLTVASGAAIDVSGQGYLGGFYDQPKNLYIAAHGPSGPAAIRKHGGSHAALGGWGYPATILSQPAYGNGSLPTQPGSGGGVEYKVTNDPVMPNQAKGHGGGVIEIIASGTVTVDGSLLADGRDGTYECAGGAGGSILVQCAAIAGEGRISADGGKGNSSNSGSGSGGRIALLYNPTVQAGLPVPDVTFSARPRLTNNRVFFSTYNSDLGTISVPDDRLLAFRHSGRWLASTPALYTVNLASLEITNAWLRVERAGFALSVANALTVHKDGRLDLTEGSVSCGSLAVTDFGVLALSPGPATSPGLSIQGDALLSHDSFLYVASGPTNGLSPYGVNATIGGSLWVTNAAWVLPQSNPTNGGSVMFTVGSLTVATNSGFSASARGYAAKVGKGYGPGGGVRNGTSKSGGGYGGAGGKGVDTQTTASATYGVEEAPEAPGSAAGDEAVTVAGQGGYGGGLIRIVSAGDVILNGTLAANGQGARNTYFAGGAGGGIFVTCRQFGGNGSMTANGGNGGTQSTQGGGGGGGGRIAVWRRSDLVNAATTQVTGGTATGIGPTGAAAPGQPGTVHWGFLPAAGSVILLR